MKKTHMFHLPRVPLISWGWCHTFALMKLFHGWCIASYGLTSLIEKSSGTGTTSRKSNLISLMFLQMVATILSGYGVMQPTTAKIKILLWFALEVYWMMKLIPLENAFPWYFAGRNLECIELYIYLIPIWCWGSWWFSLGLPILPHCSLMVLRAWPRRWAVDLKLSERTWNLSLVCKKSVLYWSGGSGERSA